MHTPSLQIPTNINSCVHKPPPGPPECPISSTVLSSLPILSSTYIFKPGNKCNFTEWSQISGTRALFLLPEMLHFDVSKNIIRALLRLTSPLLSLKTLYPATHRMILSNYAESDQFYSILVYVSYSPASVCCRESWAKKSGYGRTTNVSDCTASSLPRIT
jgi:hypothetical protein